SETPWQGEIDPTALAGIRDITTRGYTGHQMVDNVGLIHMGGRIYDPELGRFLSPDPNIPDPGNTQAYNRYAYVYNNPLSFTDPSGFVPHAPWLNLSNGADDGTNDDTADDCETPWDCLTEEEKQRIKEENDRGRTATIIVTYADGTTEPIIIVPSDASSAANNGSNSTNYQGIGITEEQRQLAADGKVREFWESRKAMGDPVADIALASLDPQGTVGDYLFGGESVNNRLQAFARVYTGNGLNLDEVRTQLMNAHIRAVDSDKTGVLGLLNPEQIARYHHTVFERLGLPTTAFGGTPFTGAVGEANWTRTFWCRGCDWE
ncbi:MAG TPA: RHS repeat-associated core domain-containing protein, partial [Gammaproteobacteria bacterium]